MRIVVRVHPRDDIRSIVPIQDWRMIAFRDADKVLKQLGGRGLHTSPPSLLRSYGVAPAFAKLHRGLPRRSFSEGGWRSRRDSNPR